MPERLLAITRAVLEAVEGLPATSQGAFVVTRDGVDQGMVLCERNRVCWATAVGLEHRLRQLLAQHVGRRLDRTTFMATPGIEEALHQHSVESLTALCGPDAGTIRWVPRAQPLQAPTSFAATELLAAVGARLYAAEAERATEGAVHPDHVVGASFAIDDDEELVVLRAVNGDRLGVAAMHGLGEWAAAALGATQGFTFAMIERAVAAMDRTVAVGWRSGRRLVHAVVIEDRATLDLAMTMMKTRRMPVVVSMRVPWSLKHAETA